MKPVLWAKLVTYGFGTDTVRDYVHRPFEDDFLDLLHQVKVYKARRLAIYSQIEVIVWGSMYIEALANTQLFGITAEGCTSDAELQVAWETQERRSVDEKAECILTKVVKTPAEKERAKELLSDFRRDKHLRDRLVHFKQQPERVDVDKVRRKWERAGRPGEMLEHVPPPRFVQTLMGVNPEARRQMYIELGAFLERWKPRGKNRP